MLNIHGDEAHTLRPDGVMKTGVVRSTRGFSPSANAYAVGQRFAQADQLAGPRDWWARLKAWARKRPGMTAAPAAAAAPDAIQSNALLPASPGASLPPSTAAPGYPGQSPHATQMAAMATFVMSGFHPSFVPGVVRGRQEAAAQVTAGTRVTMKPAMLAYGATRYADGRVGQAAWQAAVQRFYAMNRSRIR